MLIYNKPAIYGLTPWRSLLIKINHFAEFEQAIIKISHFADFEQVIIKISHFISKTPFRETGCLDIFFWGHATPASQTCTVSTGSELYPDTGFFECLGIRFFNSSHVTYRTPCCTRGHSHSPREAEDFSRGDNHSKHMPTPTYLEKYISEHKCSSKLLSQKIHGDTVFFIKWALVT